MNEQHYFLSVPVSAEIKELYSKHLADLKKQYPFKQWPHPDDLHITLVFLGAVSTKKRQELIEQINQTLTSSGLSSLTLRIGGLNTFGNERSPRILWADVLGNLEKLHKLQREINGVCKNLDLRTDNRPYRPHMTIAKKWVGQMEFLLSEDPFTESFVEWDIPYFQLIEIHPKQSPKYKEIQRFNLGGE
ncbi:RNA 2',3'-cyclic phosphodiesterase [Alkalihalophilus marmarensis]|jgi:2'-5' RNA ligase|uniref:RNA 2',3'-cyclic phosphodiesterase n=1 Tax=Alkalihalophilus marmarensis DSM 21297 TaxID=1188261 RepID=U6SLY1_9BACI|nr:RNA 2',3'-cyclic phosphodiesterase [Alkalihalophilus marmarensis]ERN52362.1 hypothetical protein A33I_16405 [Alkalihalophilus marmarensis DSM 21297]MCM3487706.1 RNA 2',3'-cyclic phosphodiesterase [Alkalihalophilus marmarensis]